jgi:hypothetical protein
MHLNKAKVDMLVSEVMVGRSNCGGTGCTTGSGRAKVNTMARVSDAGREGVASMTR